MSVKRGFKTVYAVDFDGTLCESVWPGIGRPNKELLAHLIKRRKQGCIVILWTCREDERLREAVEWCKAHGLEFDAVNDNCPQEIERFGTNSRKIHYDVLIDDKSMAKGKYGVPFGR